MIDKLLPCPFCGSKHERWVLWDHVKCSNMECSLFRIALHRVEWNTRAEDPVKAELLEALKGMMAIVGDSEGVAGYHKNGDVAEWDEFDEINMAVTAILRATGGER